MEEKRTIVYLPQISKNYVDFLLTKVDIGCQHSHTPAVYENYNDGDIFYGQGILY